MSYEIVLNIADKRKPGTKSAVANYPFIKPLVTMIAKNAVNAVGDPRMAMQLAANSVIEFSDNPVPFVKQVVRQYGFDYVMSNGVLDNEYSSLAKSQIDFLKNNNVSPQEINEIVSGGVNDAKNALAENEARARQSGFGSILPIALAFIAPGIGSAIAAQLGVSAAVGTAIASTALQVAAGADFEDALKNAVTSAVIQTGSASIAKEVNTAVSKVVENKELAANISNAAGSALASGATAAIKGGSQDDIIKSALAGAAGSITTSVTGESAFGGAVSGGILGGTTGALTGAAAALGAQAARPETKTVAETTGTSADPGVQVAGGDDASALKLSQISAMPEMLGREGEAAGAITPITDEDGVTVYKRTITGKNAAGEDYAYSVTYDPASPQGKQIYYQVLGALGGEDVAAPAAVQIVASSKRPTFETAVADRGVSGGYEPELTISGLGYISSAASSRPTPYGVLGGLGATEGIGDGPAEGGQGRGAVSGAGFGGGGTRSGGVGTVGVGGGGTTFGGAGSGGGGGRGVGLGITDEPMGDDATEREGSLAKQVPEESPFMPRISTVSAISARPGGAPTTAALSKALRTEMAAPTSTTGLTAYRPAGEIESEESGKRRQDVWNEASLRLKDALGL